MSSNNGKRRLQKRKGREKIIKANKELNAEKRRIQRAVHAVQRSCPLPNIEIDSEVGDDDIAELVRAGATRLKRSYARKFHDETLSVLSEQRHHGWTRLINNVAAEEPGLTRDRVERSFRQVVESDLGSGILQEAPEHLVRRTLPTSSFSLHPEDRHWVARCRSLREVRLEQGQYFQSPHAPTIRMGGKRRPIVFSRHALLQLADRLLPEWRKTYIGQLYIFGFFYECVHFEKTKLSNGQEALVILNSCLRAGAILRKFMRGLMGFKDDKELIHHYYIVGYCPLIETDGHAVAKTFLTPGYWQTPERRTLKLNGQLDLMRDIEQACDEGINVVSVSTSKHTKEAIRWFHSHGVPQVKRIDKEVFRDMDGPYAWIVAELEDAEPVEEVEAVEEPQPTLD